MAEFSSVFFLYSECKVMCITNKLFLMDGIDSLHMCRAQDYEKEWVNEAAFGTDTPADQILPQGSCGFLNVLPH